MRKTGYSQFVIIKLLIPKSDKKLFRLLKLYISIFSSKGFLNDFLHVGKNATASMIHTSISASISFFVQSQNTIIIVQETSDIVSLRVICFSPYRRDKTKIIVHMSVLAASAPNHQIFSPFFTCTIKATPVSIVQGSHEKAWGLIFHFKISGIYLHHV